MENSCITRYVIVGNESEIKFLFRRLQIFVYEKRAKLRTVAKFFCPEWTNYDIEGYFYDLVLNSSRRFSFAVTTTKDSHPEIWYRICREYFTVRMYYYSELPQVGHYRTNDISGNYFPHRYKVMESDGTTHNHISQAALFATSARITGANNTFTTLESLGKVASKHLHILRVFNIIVVDERGKCLTPAKDMVGQYIV